jgi:phosphatidylserine/phosphatidylglycerophosphate/cardiolipin synthase-like enzyme
MRALLLFGLLLNLVLGLAAGPLSAAEPALELVETSPIETTLDHPDIVEAADVWPKMLAAARRTIDASEFYATSQPGSRLEPVIAAIASAAARGVKVRFLVDAGFAAKEPDTVKRLEKLPGVLLRRLDWSAHGGGVLHAKYFVIDGTEAYLGSQNFDWRALTHIQELGVRVRKCELASALEDVFAADWALATGEPTGPHRFSGPVPFPIDGAQVTPVFSPRGRLPDDSLWDLPRLVEMVDSAHQKVRAQTLTYGVSELEAALLRAARRGVDVELLVSDWCKRKGCVEGLQRLATVPHITVKFLVVPPAKAGFIPFARVAHAKYLVVDGAVGWVGSSNLERDYFEKSRNVGLIVRGGGLPAQLDRFFESNWRSPYSEIVVPTAHYTPPRVH